MADFSEYLKNFSPLTEEAEYELLQSVTTRKYAKGKCLLRRNEVCRQLFFLNEGLIKSSFQSGDKEFIMRFFWENLLFSVFDSYITQTPSKCKLVALEDTTVTLVNFDAMEALCKKHHCMETFFRKLVSAATVKMMKRISEMLEQSPAERYKQFMQENGPVLQRISLGGLAQYLGITQQSLSRIRATY